MKRLQGVVGSLETVRGEGLWRLWQQVSPPWKAAIFPLVRAFRKTFAFPPKTKTKEEEERKASVFLSTPDCPVTLPPFLFPPPRSRVLAVFFSFPFPFSPLSGVFVWPRPRDGGWNERGGLVFCVLRETGFFPMLNYKTALQLFFPQARYFSSSRSLSEATFYLHCSRVTSRSKVAVDTTGS